MPPVTERLPGVQALRGIAALLVVLVHYATAAFEHGFGWPGIERIQLGHAGVDIFFVLSGFIMEYTAGGSPDRRGFILRRAARVLPLYWVLTIIAYALVVFAPTVVNRDATVGQFALSMVLLPGVSPNGNGHYVLGMAWTLSYELWFYAVFALLMPFTAPVRLAGLAIVFAGAIAIGIVLDPASPVARIPVDPLVLEFLVGVGLAMTYRAGLRWRPAAALLIACAAVLALAFRHDAYAADGFRRLALWGLPAAGIVFAVVLGRWQAGGVLARLLARLGDISYSLYLSHFFAIATFVLLRKTWPGALPLAISALACLALAILYAEACYRLIEAPARARLSLRTRAAAGGAPAHGGASA